MWRILAVAALMSAAVLAPPPVAADGPPLLILTSSGGSASAEIVLAEDLVLTRVFPPAMSRTGCGRYAGYFLTPLDGQTIAGTTWFDGTGWLDVAAFEYGSVHRLPLPLGDAASGTEPLLTVPQGRYRAFLFGEGQCEVRVPVVDGVGADGVLAVTVTTPAPVQFGYADLNVAGRSPETPQAGGGALPIQVGPGTFAYVALHTLHHSQHYTYDATVASYHACLDESPAPFAGCPFATGDDAQDGYGGAYYSASYVSPHESWQATNVYVGYYPGLPGGTYYGKGDVIAPNNIRQTALAVFAFEPG